MPKKPRVRTLMGSQHAKGSETLLKSAWQYFSRIFFISMRENQLEKRCLSNILNLETVCEHIDTR